jgi:hypothetical protein
MGAIDDFLLERSQALMSLDEAQIRAFYRKWNADEAPTDPLAFWTGVHLAITQTADLPEELREASRRWLDERGHSGPQAFWTGVHLAITQTTDLPEELREASRRWLDERGHSAGAREEQRPFS